MPISSGSILAKDSGIASRASGLRCFTRSATWNVSDVLYVSLLAIRAARDLTGGELLDCVLQNSVFDV